MPFFRTEDELPVRDSDGTINLCLEIFHDAERLCLIDALIEDESWVCSDQKYAKILQAENEEAGLIADIYICFGEMRADENVKSRALVVIESTAKS